VLVVGGGAIGAARDAAMRGLSVMLVFSPPPAPMPTITRPFEMWSTVDTHIPSKSGCLKVIGVTSVLMRTRVVSRAIAPNSDQGS
jgi:hypothetical protein